MLRHQASWKPNPSSCLNSGHALMRPPAQTACFFKLRCAALCCAASYSSQLPFHAPLLKKN